MLDLLHPTVAAWFRSTLGAPSAPQREGWPQIRAGHHTLIAAPTGSGKTLTAFLNAIDSLLRQGAALTDCCQVLYVSPLKALSNDVHKNLQRPLAEIAALDPSLPTVRVMVRTGDTPAHERTAMTKRPPHILVTTPESLFILLTTVRGRAMLGSVRTVIVDEIHALLRDKRGSHLALSLERLDRLVTQQGGQLQRIGLSATQRPIEATARLLVGTGRDCHIVDTGHLRQLDLGLVVPPQPLEVVCSTEHWESIYRCMVELIRQHRTTLVFVNTRKMAERVAARLAEHLGKEHCTSHHGSLSKERRLMAEQRLKAGELKALVATSSLELGIDIGDVDLVLQVGPTPTIAALLQRVGRAGHGLGRTPKGRLLPLTRDELAASAALLYAVRQQQLDKVAMPTAPLDILAQQLVAMCAHESFDDAELLALCRRAAPFAALDDAVFAAVLELHSQGRAALLHRDGVQHRVHGTRRSALAAVTSGGAIPDNADYRVMLDPENVLVGTVNEDFAVESSIGDVFQLGNQSWQIRRIESGTLRVSDAKGVPPNLPFWFGEAPARSQELCAALSVVRQRGTEVAWLQRECGLAGEAALQLADYLQQGKDALGVVPSLDQLVLERFFDETGGQQLVLHCPFGSRINRAFGLALRKRFCVGFGFELQAAANEEALLISLGPMHSFELHEVWHYLQPRTAENVLVQALLQAPVFQTRWRWNVTRALLVERFRHGKRVPAPLLRMRADDALAGAFPAVQACPETLDKGPIEVPMQHPIVGQTVRDCLTEAMDIDGLLQLLTAIHGGTIALRECERSEPSPFAEGILHAMPYAFLDDAPLEERRTQAVISAQRGAASRADDGGELDRDAVELVQRECWPDPRDLEELHAALSWMGFLRDAEVEAAWRPWLAALAAAGRAQQHADRWFAAEQSREPVELWRGRLEATGPLPLAGFTGDDLAAVAALQAEGTVLRAHYQGELHVCHRRLLARIRRYMVERLRQQIAPVGQLQFQAFQQQWQHATPDTRLDGPHGTALVLQQLAGREFPAAVWEDELLPQRVRDYKREWLDQLTLSGEYVWLHLSGRWRGPLGKAPLAIVPRQDLGRWLQLAATRREAVAPTGPAQQILGLLQARGALFPTELQQEAKLLPSWLENGLSELVGLGCVSCDSFAAVRQLVVPPSKRRFPVFAVGRWSLVPEPGAAAALDADTTSFAAKALLQRHGVLAWMVLAEEKVLPPWRLLLRELRAMELRGELRGGRFVAGFSGEQFALPAAVTALRAAAQPVGAG